MSSNSSFDIGGHTGAETQALTYVPGAPLRVYLAHPITSYDSPEESRAIETIRRYVGDVELVNPNLPEHQAAYLAMKDSPETCGDAMRYWLDLASTCTFCVFFPFLDGRIGSGVWAEVETFFTRFGTEARVYEYEDINRRLVFRNRDYFDAPGRVLTVEQTKTRVKRFRQGHI